MIKRALLSLLLVLLISAIIISCAQPAPAPTPTPTPAPSQSPKPAPIKLKYAEQNPEKGWAATHASIPWLKQMEDATSGAVQFEAYYSNTLIKAQDAWEAVKADLADVAQVMFVFTPGMFSLTHELISLPFLPMSTAEAGSAVLWRNYEKYPSVQKQFADNKVVLLWAASPNLLVTTNKLVKTMDDIKGMKIRTPPGSATEMVKALGAVPVAVPMPDTYLNLQKGVVDGAIVTWEAILTFKFYEVAKYYTIAPLLSNGFCQAFNIQKWNSLDTETQKQIMSVCGLKGSKFWGNGFNSTEDAVSPIIKERKYDMIKYTVPPDELAKWRKIAGEPLWDAWVKAEEAKGHPEARDILNDTIKFLKEYK